MNARLSLVAKPEPARSEPPYDPRAGAATPVVLGDPALDALVRTAAHGLDCPIALVHLIEDGHRCFKARIGLDGHDAAGDLAFGTHAMLGREPLVVPDTRLDDRFAQDALVTGPAQLRFYAGVPILLQGLAVGALCVLDRRPRLITAEQARLLVALAGTVERWLEVRREPPVR